MTELKPCPFCGGNDLSSGYASDGWEVWCRECYGAMLAYNPDAKEKAIDKWNTRVDTNEPTDQEGEV